MKRSGASKLLAILLIAPLLAGCAAAYEYPKQLPEESTVPPAPPSGDEPVDEFETELFFISEDGRLLSPETRVVSRFAGSNRAEAALLELEKGPVSPSLAGSVPRGLSLDRVELSRDAANVYYKGVFPGEFRQWLILRASVAATVSAAEGMVSVNVYFDGMEPGYNGRALGATPPIEGALDVYLGNLRQEYEVLPGSTEAGNESRVGTLYFLDSARNLLRGSSRQLNYDKDADTVEIAKYLLKELISGPTVGGLEPVLPADLALAEDPKLEYISPPAKGAAGKICVIDLVFNKPSSELESNFAYGSVVLTLTGYLQKVQGVRISFAGESPAEGETSGDYYVRDDFAQFLGDQVPVYTEAGSYESRVVTLYFLDTARSLLLGSNRQLHYNRRADNVTIIKDILGELILGPRANGLEPVLPADLALSQDPKLETVSPSAFTTPGAEGGSVLDLRFAVPSQDFDERSACGSIVLTLTGYIPQLAGVRISFVSAEGEVRNASPDGYFTRDDFTDLLGQPVTVAFPDPDGSALYRVERAVPQSSIYDAGARLTELFRGPADPGVLYPVFTENDVDKVYISGDTAVINWKEGFSKRLSELMEAETSLPKERREQLFVFSVVNTVTEIPGISRVLMLENGRMPVSAGRIWFGNPLLRNPKLYVED